MRFIGDEVDGDWEDAVLVTIRNDVALAISSRIEPDVALLIPA